jgi:hypothetical protein
MTAEVNVKGATLEVRAVLGSSSGDGYFYDMTADG